jgi:MinD-like ATPase involved in chromosome partitioning or flagellar assembly
MTLGILVALGSASFEPVVLAAVGRGQSHVVRRCVDIADLLATAASGQGQVALVSPHLPGLDRHAVDAIESAGIMPIGMVERASDPAAEILRRLGVRSTATVDVEPDSLESLIVALAARRRPAADPANGERDRGTSDTATEADDGREPPADPPVASEPSRGQLIAVWGHTGAPGRTFLSLRLGAAIADLGGDTLVIDADVYGGALGQTAGVLDEASGLLAATRAANAGSLDVASLSCRSLQIGPSLRVLTGLPRADRWVEAKAVLVRAVLSTARRLASHIVVDCGFSLEVDEEVMYDTRAPRRNGATLAVLGQADVVLVVGAADPIGLSRLIRAIADLADAVPRAEPVVVVNRFRDGIGWSRDDITALLQKTAGASRVAFLPDDPVACDRALVAGKSIIESTPERALARRLRELAADVTGLHARPGRRWRGPSRWIGRVSGGRQRTTGGRSG